MIENVMAIAMMASGPFWVMIDGSVWLFNQDGSMIRKMTIAPTVIAARNQASRNRASKCRGEPGAQERLLNSRSATIATSRIAGSSACW